MNYLPTSDLFKFNSFIEVIFYKTPQSVKKVKLHESGTLENMEKNVLFLFSLQ